MTLLRTIHCTWNPVVFFFLIGGWIAIKHCNLALMGKVKPNSSTTCNVGADFACMLAYAFLYFMLYKDVYEVHYISSYMQTEYIGRLGNCEERPMISPYCPRKRDILIYSQVPTSHHLLGLMEFLCKNNMNLVWGEGGCTCTFAQSLITRY